MTPLEHVEVRVVLRGRVKVIVERSRCPKCGTIYTYEYEVLPRDVKWVKCYGGAF
jgi:hypothetical protein